MRRDARLAMTASYDPVRYYPEWEMGECAGRVGAERECWPMRSGLGWRYCTNNRAVKSCFSDGNRKVFLERPTGSLLACGRH